MECSTIIESLPSSEPSGSSVDVGGGFGARNKENTTALKVCSHVTSTSTLLLKSRSHGTMCDCDLLYQEMECYLRFSDFIHKV